MSEQRDERFLQRITRRAFLGRAAQGVGTVALASLLGQEEARAAAGGEVPHPIRGYPTLAYPAQAQRVIWMTMAGGPSHLETFDPKPKLAEMDGKPMPESFTKGQQLAQLQGAKLICYGPQHPFSGEKLSPVLAFYRVKDFDEAIRVTAAIYDYQGKGHSVSLHTKDERQAMRLALELPVARVIVNQAHCFATGGSFDNGLPFSLSMGCGTWGRNNFSDNLNFRHYLNITRISRPIPERVPTEAELFGRYFEKYGAA